MDGQAVSVRCKRLHFARNGCCTLRCSSASVQPLPNDDPAQKCEPCRAGVHWARDLASSGPLSEFLSGELFPGSKGEPAPL